ncbi:hypothetical protein IL992_44455 [Microbispora sp. NEAU-D428]|uniref:hypothetical protein n=1 Tax=Microbispora sitophila TaxID=2771537 RepID=UPI00186671A0|nr:hypothetical protein [Microbispora sitophila]MBE3016152.1 hypothetical protein [Microbispora sitophila]
MPESTAKVSTRLRRFTVLALGLFCLLPGSALVTGTAAAADDRPATGVSTPAPNEGCAVTKKAPIPCSLNPKLQAAYRSLIDRAWHPDAKKITYAAYVTDNGSKLHAVFGADGAAAARELSRVYGDEILIENQELAQFSGGRTNDASPHWGGASISQGLDPCTSAFSVVFADGRRGSVSAGHCYENDEPLLSSAGYLSLGPFYGITEGKKDYPSYDMIAISGGGAYTNTIYTDPGSPISRTVIGKADPTVGTPDAPAYVCVSGRLHLAKCSIQVKDVSALFCPGGSPSCTPDVMLGYRGDSAVAGQGDSGAPVYSPASQSGAIIRGMLIGGSIDGHWIFAEQISDIEQHLGVTVATTP